MDSGQCRSAVCERLLTQILRLLTWLEPESTQALTWYLCFTLFECLDPDLPFFCICSPHCRRHLDEQIMALLRITSRATVRVVEADRTFSARPFFYFRLGNTRAILQTVSAPLLEMCARVQGVRESSPLQMFQSANVFAGLVSTALRLRYQARVLHLDIAFNAITYQRGPRGVFPTSARTMHSAGSQLPRRPCPAARPTTTHPTQGSTTTGIRATPAAALSETPEIASQAAPPPSSPQAPQIAPVSTTPSFWRTRCSARAARNRFQPFMSIPAPPPTLFPIRSAYPSCPRAQPPSVCTSKSTLFRIRSVYPSCPRAQPSSVCTSKSTPFPIRSVYPNCPRAQPPSVCTSKSR